MLTHLYLLLIGSLLTSITVGSTSARVLVPESIAAHEKTSSILAKHSVKPAKLKETHTIQIRNSLTTKTAFVIDATATVMVLGIAHLLERKKSAISIQNQVFVLNAKSKVRGIAEIRDSRMMKTVSDTIVTVIATARGIVLKTAHNVYVSLVDRLDNRVSAVSAKLKDKGTGEIHDSRTTKTVSDITVTATAMVHGNVLQADQREYVTHNPASVVNVK